MAISTNGAIITRLAGALYNEYLSNATYAEVKDKSASTSKRRSTEDRISRRDEEALEEAVGWRNGC